MKNKDTSLVSVVMNFYNIDSFLKESLDSVFSQSYENFEVIFIDNNSSTDVTYILDEYDRRLKYTKLTKNIPLAEARNIAIERCSGEFIAFLDCDDIWTKDKLKEQLLFFNHKRIGLVYSNYISFNLHGDEYVAYDEKWDAPTGDVFDIILFNNFICFSSIMIRSSIIKKHDIYFDPSLRYVEDTDFFIMLSRNCDFNYLPEIVVKYRMHEQSMTTKNPLSFRDEEKYLLDKYANIFPEFDEQKQNKYKVLIKKDRAITLWKIGDVNLARKLLREIFWVKKRYILIYIATFIKADYIYRLRAWIFKRKYRYHA